MTDLNLFMSERRQLDLQTADALKAQYGGRGVTLPGNYTARLTCDVRVDDLTTLKAGAMCEIVGEYARFWGGQLVFKSAIVDGVRVPALGVVERLPAVDK